MKEILKEVAAIAALCVVSALFASVLSGCTATKTTIQEFDASGTLTKQTVTSESMVREVVESTKGKTVIAWENGWSAYLAGSTATTDDPTPTVKAWAGKVAKGLITAQPDQQNWDGIARAIAATKENLNVSASGISGSSAGTASQLSSNP